MSANKRPGAGSKPAKVADLFGADSEEDEEDAAPSAKRPRGAAPAAATPAPLDPEVQNVADKLALYVAHNGRSFEDLTRQRNPGATPFSFLHDKYSRAYKYYDAKVREHEAALGKAPAASTATATAAHQQRPGTSAPAPAAAAQQQRRNRWDAAPPAAPTAAAAPAAPPSRYTAAPTAAAASISASTSASAPSSAPRPGESSADALARMNAYMQSLESSKAKAADGDDDDDDEARRRRAKPLLNETAFDRRRVTAVFKNDGSRATHMGDYIPPEELAKFMAKSGDPAAQQATQAAQTNTIGADNVGHKLLQKMGWKEGKGIGASEAGAVAPIAVTGAVAPGGASGVPLGLGAKEHGAVEESDDPFEVYRKRMMLGYKFRPNPLGNPRRDYWSNAKQ